MRTASRRRCLALSWCRISRQIETRPWPRFGVDGALVHLNGRGLVAGRIQRLNPKASITPEFPCLCAPLGGPLPVRALPSEATARDTSSKFELLQPHFRLTVTLDLQAERQPLAGELGWVNLGHHRTCGHELLSWLTRWTSRRLRGA